nr:PREDICTED: phospholipase B1, membrane-associated-like [Bemisia tabaci]
MNLFSLGLLCFVATVPTVYSAYNITHGLPWTRWNISGKDEDLPRFFRFSPEQFVKFRKMLQSAIGKSSELPHNIKLAKKIKKFQTVLNGPFPCNTSNARSAVVPTSVHEVRPGDIDVVAAIGDSLTAGNGAAATNVFHVAIENRGISWSIGGQKNWREHMTIPNILREFNQNLIGYSKGDSIAQEKKAHFNVAEIGAISTDMPFMARVLVKRIRADPNVDFEKHWKLVTLMIGSNDFCTDLCYSPDIWATPEKHKKDIENVLDYLQANLPRTIVNFVVAPNLQIITEFSASPPLCYFTHVAECYCLFAAQYKHNLRNYIKVMELWQNAEEELVNLPKYKTSDDFAVVLQTFTRDLTFPTKKTRFGNTITDWSYLSADCFHFSQKGYQRAANALWNNMLEPVGNKSRDWKLEMTRFLCPTEESPYICTWKNCK